MLLEKFSKIIEASPVGRALDRKAHIIEIADPKRFYVENVRAFLNIPLGLAAAICELGVRSGQFRKKIGYSCPGCHRIIMEADYDNPLPENLEAYCQVCDLYDNADGPKSISECEKTIFYSLAADE